MKLKSRIMKYFLAGLSGILLVLGFPEFNLWSLSWVALVPLLVAIHGTNWKQSFWLGFLAGGIYFFGIMNWLMILVPFSTFLWVFLGYAVLSIYLACYVFLFTVSINYITGYWHRTGFQRISYIFLVAVAWTGLEILRGYVASGLPWASLGYTQWTILPVIQISSFVGMYGVTFLIGMFNGLIALFLIDIRYWKDSLKSAVIPLLILVASLTYGIISLNQPTGTETIKMALVPGNIKQKDKMTSWGRKSGWIFDKYFQETQRTASEEPKMIVWPETAVPMFIFPESEELERIKNLLSTRNAYMLIGAISYKEAIDELLVYNSSFMLTPKGDIIDQYDKTHLVPISEKFPFKRYLPKKLQKLVTGVSDFESGKEYTVFHSPIANIGTPICFESVFPQISREFIKNGANLIGIITNDSWFVGTFAAQQHFSMAPFRAVENRVSVFRCANYGVSCIIDPYGRVIKKLEPENGKEYVIGDVGVYKAGTLYTKYGDYFPWTCLAILLFLITQTWWFEYHRRGDNVDWYLEGFRKYAAFKGRACRKEFWIFTFFNNIIYYLILGFILIIAHNISLGLIEAISIIWSLVVLIPSIAVSVRRLHDTNHSGLWLLTGFIPLLGIVLLVFMVMDSQPEKNQYGSSTKKTVI